MSLVLQADSLCMQMIGIWCLTVWQQLGNPSKMRLVELGPGRGTLMADLLRGTAPFKPFTSGLDIHLVEVSYRNRLVIQSLSPSAILQIAAHGVSSQCQLLVQQQQ